MRDKCPLPPCSNTFLQNDTCNWICCPRLYHIYSFNLPVLFLNFLGLMMVNATVKLNVYPSSVRHAMFYNLGDENYHCSQKFMKLILKHFVTWNCNGQMHMKLLVLKEITHTLLLSVIHLISRFRFVLLYFTDYRQ